MYRVTPMTVVTSLERGDHDGIGTGGGAESPRCEHCVMSHIGQLPRVKHLYLGVCHPLKLEVSNTDLASGYCLENPRN